MTDGPLGTPQRQEPLRGWSWGWAGLFATFYLYLTPNLTESHHKERLCPKTHGYSISILFPDLLAHLSFYGKCLYKVPLKGTLLRCLGNCVLIYITKELQNPNSQTCCLWCIWETQNAEKGILLWLWSWTHPAGNCAMGRNLGFCTPPLWISLSFTVWNVQCVESLWPLVSSSIA